MLVSEITQTTAHNQEGFVAAPSTAIPQCLKVETMLSPKHHYHTNYSLPIKLGLLITGK